MHTPDTVDSASRLLLPIPPGPLLVAALFVVACGAGWPASGQPSPVAASNAGLQTPAMDGKLIQPAGGGPLEGIVVTILETGATAAVDAHGSFAFTAVAPGTYTLEASGAGYARLKITGVVVSAAKTLTVAEEMPLKAAGGEETVAAPAGHQGIQQLAEYYVTAAAVSPFAGGANLDIPRTSDDIQPYTIINREAIEESNRTDLGDFLQDQLTQDAQGSQYAETPAFQSPVNASAASQVNLRGLGSLQTLILVNGVRLSDEANKAVVAQPNINQIPLSAVDHIEVLPSSASAIYGSSAIGGVINIVLKNNYTGGEIDANYQNTFDTDSPVRSLSGSYGFSIGKKTNVTLIASYQDGKPPVWQDRPFDINYYFRALDNDPSLFFSNTVPYTSGATPNIVLDTATVDGYANPSSKSLILKNGTSLNSLVTYVPTGTSPSTSAASLDAGLIADAGMQNLAFAQSVYRGDYAPLLVEPKKESFSASIDHRFTDALDAFVNLGAYHSTSVSNFTAPVAASSPNASFTQYVAVPGSAPDNPFEQNVLVSMPLPYNEASRLSEFWNTRSASFGLLGHLPGDWETLAEYSWGGNYTKTVYPFDDFNSSTLYGGDEPVLYSGFFNPFVDTMAYPQNESSYNYLSGSQVEGSTLSDFNLRANGPVFTLPGGRPQLTAGLEDRLDITGPFKSYVFYAPLPGGPTPNPTDGYTNYTAGQSESTQAAYVEAELPLVSEKNGVPLLDALELQVAGRIEKFTVISDPGTALSVLDDSSDTVAGRSWGKFESTNPTFGFKYKPFRTLTFRGSYAAAFIPPTYAELGGTTSTVSADTTAATFDPVTGLTYAVPRNTGDLANPSLRPQTSRAWDAGAIWEPDTGLLTGLRVDLEFYKIIEYNLIYAPTYAQALTTPSLSYLVPRSSPTGLVQSFTEEYINMSQQYTDGWDLSFDYRKPTSFGTFGLHASATVIEHLKEPYQIGGPLVEYSGFADSGGVIKTKGNATATWLVGDHWTLGWTTLYYDGYKAQGAPGDPEYNGATTETLVTTQTLPQGGYSIPSQVYHNAFVNYRFGVASTGLHLMDGVTVGVGVNDVFNSAPPFDANSTYAPFYNSPYGSVLLRTYVLKVKKEF